MRSKILPFSILLFFFGLTLPARGQVSSSTARHIVPTTALPSTCSVANGDVYYLRSGAAADQGCYECCSGLALCPTPPWRRCGNPVPASSGITGSGTSGQVSYFTTASNIGGSSNLTWDNTNKRLFIGPATTISDNDALNLSSNSGGIFRQRVAGSGSAPVHYFLQSNGTIAAPTTSADDAILGTISAAGYSTGGNFVDAATLYFGLDGAIGGAGGAAGKFYFNTGSALGPPSTKFLIDSTSTTAQSFAYLGANRALRTTAAPTNGQLLIGSTGADPVAGTITAGSGITVTNGAGSITIAASGGGGTAQIIEPASKFPVTTNLVFPNTFIGSGSGWKYFGDLGVADATTLNADATWALLYHLPPALPIGTAKLRLQCFSGLSSGALKFNPKWNVCAAGTDCSSVTLNAEGTQTVTYTVADAFVEVDTTLDASTVTAGTNLIMNLVFEDTGTTAAGNSTCSAFLVFIP